MYISISIREAIEERMGESARPYVDRIDIDVNMYDGFDEIKDVPWGKELKAPKRRRLAK